MASSRGTSNGPDSVDVGCVMIAFEELNNCRLAVEIRIPVGATDCTLEVEVSAYTRETFCGVPRRLACQRFLTGLKDRRTIDAAILQGLYRVDGVLAHEAFAETIKKP